MSDLDDEELEATRILNGSKNKYDKTSKYVDMIEAFECDFAVHDINKNDNTINFNFEITPKIIKDIELLNELSFELRHGNLKIVEKELIEENKKLKEISLYGIMKSQYIPIKFIKEKINELNEIIRLCIVNEEYEKLEVLEAQRAILKEVVENG